MAGVNYGVRETRTAGAWVQDELGREHVLEEGGRLDPAQFPRLGTVVVTTPGGAAAAATSIGVSALSGPIPSGTVLDFTGAGEFARLSAPAVQGATTLTVEALDAAIEAGDSATYVPAGNPRRFVPSGTLVGRSFAERDAGTPFGPAVAGDGERYLIVHDVFDADKNPEVALYRPGSLVAERYLPAGVDIAQVRALYQTIKGRA